MNVFRKCLRREFGENQYGMYVLMCQEQLDQQREQEEINLDGKAVYQDMYEHVMKMEKDEINERKEALMMTLVKAFQIGRQFWFVFLFYLMASFFLIALGLQPVVTYVGLILMGMCFLYKIYEYVSNKYCFVDAYLVMVYKTALEKAASQS